MLRKCRDLLLFSLYIIVNWMSYNVVIFWTVGWAKLVICRELIFFPVFYRPNDKSIDLKLSLSPSAFFNHSSQTYTGSKL